MISLSERLSALESSAAVFTGPKASASSNEALSHHASATGLPEKEKTANDSATSSYVGQQNWERMERRPANPLITNAKDGLIQQTSEGTRFMQRVLESNPLLGTSRSSVLREAIDFVGRLSTLSTPSFATDTFEASEMRGDRELQGFPPELLYVMTMSECVDVI